MGRKIDTSKIAGYNEMTAEEKVQALERATVSTEGLISKTTFDETASDLAKYKRLYNEKLTEDEKNKLIADEKEKELQKELKALSRRVAISDNIAKFAELGYNSELAEETATALIDGKMDVVFANQKKFNDEYEKKLRADILKAGGTPPQGGNPDEAMTIDKFRSLSFEERANFAVEHPTEYAKLYES